MLARSTGIELFDKVFEKVEFTDSELEAYSKGQLDYWQEKPCNPLAHGYAELTKERNNYEAGYTAEEAANG